jgi:hypothetical protein
VNTLLLTAVFFRAIAYCETRGERQPDLAVGADGLSFGRYQITRTYMEDVNRISGRKYTRRDCFNPSTAEEMITIYLNHYATAKRLGRHPTMVDMALIHHHGPDGWRQAEEQAHYVKTFEEGLACFAR